MAHPEAAASSIVSWDDVSYVAVTVDADYELSWWIIDQNDEKEWEVAPLVIG
jgi:hypothetical protein